MKKIINYHQRKMIKNIFFLGLTLLAFEVQAQIEKPTPSLASSRDLEYGVFAFNPLWVSQRDDNQKDFFERVSLFSLNLKKHRQELAFEYFKSSIASGNQFINIQSERFFYSLVYHYYPREKIYLGPLLGILDANTTLKALDIESHEKIPSEIFLGGVVSVGNLIPLNFKDHNYSLYLFFEIKILWIKSLNPNPLAAGGLRLGLYF